MKKKALFIIILVVFITIAFVILTSRPKAMSEAEKEKALNALGLNQRLTNSNTKKGDIEHKGKYTSFLYPASATVYNFMLNGKKVEDKGALEYFAFDMQSPRVIVTTEVIQAPSVVTSVVDYPSVRLRQQDTSYKQSGISADGTAGLSFEKTDNSGFEKTGFFFVKNRIYTFSVSSSDKKTALNVFQKMIGSLKFL